MADTDSPWLEDEQKQLLSTLVKAFNSVERQNRQDFVLEPSFVRTKGVISREKVRAALVSGVVIHGGEIIRSEDQLPANWDVDLVRHPGLDESVVAVLITDLDALKLEGLLYFRDETHFAISPKGFRFEEFLRKSLPTAQTDLFGLAKERPNPRVFVSYTWESDEHNDWVRSLSERLASDGVAVTLDQWELYPGDQLPAFMERSVRENDYVLVVCTPTYKRKSDTRQGGAGYEGDIITAEIVNGANRRKFIPIHRLGEWKEAAPSWIAGAYHINLTGNPYSEGSYNDLTNTLHGLRPTTPAVGPIPTQARPVSTPDAPSATSSRSPSMTAVAPQKSGLEEPIQILNVIVDEVTQPRNDGSHGSGLYTVPFQLSRAPSQIWATCFAQIWNNPPEYTTMHRPGIGRVVGSKVLLEGTTIDEVEKYHKRTLMLVVDRTNQIIAEHVANLRRKAEAERLQKEQHEQSIRDIAARITFDR